MNHSIKKLVFAAAMAALACVATLVHVPAPLVGYIHVGDAIVLLSAALLGPLYGTAGAAIGSLLADLLLGYAAYAPATFLIKGAVALVFALLCRRVKAEGFKGYLWLLLCGALSECLMIGGYFVYELFLYDLGAALPGLWLNGIQAAIGAVLGALLVLQVRRIRVFCKF